MQVSCRSCGEGVPAEDVNLDHMMAKCRRCQAVFSIAELAPAGAAASARAEVPMPQRIQREEGIAGFGLVKRWYSPKFLFLVFFCVIWNGFLVFWYGMAAATDAPWIMVVFPIGHVLVGLGLTWLTVCGLVNRTRIRVEHSQLTVRHSPLWWPGNRTLDTSDIEQIYCKEKTWTSNRSRTVHTHYSVHAVTRDRKKVKLLSGLDEIEQALYVEQELERHLRLEDRPVAGEISRR